MNFAISKEDLLKTDNLLLSGMALLALTFGYLSFTPTTILTDGGEGDPVATLANTESEVKRKQADGLAWDRAFTDDKLYAGDQIFTETQAQAQVRFDDGSQMEVAENSLIKIQKKGDRTTIDMTRGFVSGAFGGKKGYALQMGDTKVDLSEDAEIQVNVDSQDSSKRKIALAKGNANVSSGDGKNSMALGQDQVLNVDTKTGKTSVERLLIKPTGPASGSEFDRGSKRQLRLQWQAAAELDSFQVLIARDNSFENVVKKRTTARKALAFPTPGEGTYYWKVTSRGGEGKLHESLTRSFTIFSRRPPVLVAPTGGKEYSFTETEERRVSLIWESADYASAYRLDVARNRSFKNPVIRKKIDGTSFEMKGARQLASGKFFWRVRSLTPDGRASEPSPTANFRVAEARRPAPPKAVEPEDEFQIPQDPTTPVAFSWKDVPNADGFRIEISQSPNFDEDALVTRTQTQRSRFNFSPDRPGLYYWRLQSVDPYGRETKWGAARSLRVTRPAPSPITPAQGDTPQLKRGKPLVFRWEATDAAAYRLEVARDEQFQKPLFRMKTRDTQFRWKKPKPGPLYWRIHSLDRSGKSGPASAPVPFRPREPEPLQPPELNRRYYFRLPVPSQGNAWLWRVLDSVIGIPTAYAQTVDGDSVDVRWNKIEGAETYQVQLATDEAFNNVVVDRKAKGPQFRWRDAKPGRYYMRAASVDASGKRGEYSPASTLLVSREAPRPYKPEANSSLDLEAASAPVSFSWQNTGAPRYVFEWSESATFDNPRSRETTASNRHETTFPRTGTYFWRVGARYARGLPWEYSEPQRLSVRVPPAMAPRPLRPEAGASVKISGEEDPVTFTWENVKAPSYEVVVAAGANFTDPVFRETLSQSTTARTPLEEGTYFWRVRAVGSQGEKGPFSKTRKFRVSRPPPPPQWNQPEMGASLSAVAGEPTAVTFSWSASGGTGGYRLQVSQSQTFAGRVRNRRPATSGEELRLPPGRYFARVRAVGEDQVPGAWSDVQRFRVEKTKPEPPEPVTPRDGSELPPKAGLELSWKKSLGFKGYRVVVAKDRNFKDVVAKRRTRGDASRIKLNKNGTYYWYVEGRNRRARMAARSSVQAFRITPAANLHPGRGTGLGAGRVRLRAAIAPSVISNAMTSNTVSNSLGVTVLNSWILEGRYGFSDAFSLGASYHRKSAELFEDSAGLAGSEDQKVLPFTPQEFGLRTHVRVPNVLGLEALSLEGRGGYLYKTFFTYYAKSRTALGLQEAAAHHGSLGGDASWALTPSTHLVAAFDYARALATASSTEVQSGSHTLLHTGVRLQAWRSWIFGLAYRYGVGSYGFSDPKHATTGTLEETTHTGLASLSTDL